MYAQLTYSIVFRDSNRKRNDLKMSHAKMSIPLNSSIQQ